MNEHGLLDSTDKRVTASVTAAPKARPNPGEGDTSPGSFSEAGAVKPRHWFESNTDGFTTEQVL